MANSIPEPESILDAMHSAILTADFARLGDLAPQLETALHQVEQLRDRPRLQRLQSKAQRNEACLLAAGRGVRAAGRRLRELHEAAAGLITYNGRGQRADLGQHSNLTRRY